MLHSTPRAPSFSFNMNGKDRWDTSVEREHAGNRTTLQGHCKQHPRTRRTRPLCRHILRLSMILEPVPCAKKSMLKMENKSF